MFQLFGKKFREDYIEFVAKTTGKKELIEKFKDIMNESELDIKTDMVLLILKNSFECLDKINATYKELFNKNSIFTVFYGTDTITAVSEKRFNENVTNNLKDFLIQRIDGVVKIHIKGSKSIQTTPGLVYSIVSGFANYGINILSLLGSYDEILIFIESKDFDKLTNMLKEIKK